MDDTRVVAGTQQNGGGATKQKRSQTQGERAKAWNSREAHVEVDTLGLQCSSAFTSGGGSE